MYLNPLSRSRVSRIAWSWFRHPVKCREFPAKAERLITADELLRYGVLATSDDAGYDVTSCCHHPFA